MNLLQLPMWLLSGSFFSYERFPEAFWPAIRLLPDAVNDALRAIFRGRAAARRHCRSSACSRVGGCLLAIAVRRFAAVSCRNAGRREALPVRRVS